MTDAGKLLVLIDRWGGKRAHAPEARASRDRYSWDLGCSKSLWYHPLHGIGHCALWRVDAVPAFAVKHWF